MNDFDLLDFIKRKVKERENQISETLMSGSLKDIEHYKYLQGELSVIYYLEDEISDLGKQL